MMRGIDREGEIRAPLRIKAVIIAELNPQTRLAWAFDVCVMVSPRCRGVLMARGPP